jgi:uncharacterized protein (TIGR02271 family)
MNDSPMGANVNDMLIQDGWMVHSSDDQKIGSIAEAHPDYLLVQKGFLFKKDLYVPTTQVESTDAGAGVVFLRVMKDQIDNMPWDEPPTATAATGSTTGADYQTSGYGAANPAGEVHLREEQLSTRKHEVEAGEVEVGKRVVSEKQTLDVPVTRDEVQVERKAVSPRPAEGDIGEGDTVRVPLRAEEVEVEKRSMVTEEVELHKTPVTENRRVEETVRHEEPVIKGADQGMATSGVTGSTEQLHEHRFINGRCADCDTLES